MTLGTLGPPEMLLIAAAILLLFGAKRLPDLARGLGRSARELRKGLSGEEDEPPEEAAP